MAARLRRSVGPRSARSGWRGWPRTSATGWRTSAPRG
jgi:hypothetical protein